VSDLAPILQGFFTDRMITQKHASEHTIRSYRDTWRLLLAFAQDATGTPPWKLDIGQLDAGLVTSFLRWLETSRNCSPSTRNARLSAIRSLFRYASLRAPDNAAVIQRVLAIEASRTDTTIVNWLTDAESGALLAVPDQETWTGCRDYALLLTAIRTGLRVSELTRLTRADIRLGTGKHVRCTGKGRKERCTPLDAQAVAALRAWLDRQPGRDGDPLFVTRRGTAMSATRSTPASPDTSRPPRNPALRWPGRTSPRTRSGIPRPCTFATPASTAPSSPCGWAIRTSGPRRSTSTPTSSSRRRRWTASPRRTFRPGASSRRTSSSPSSKACDLTPAIIWCPGGPSH